MAEQKKRNIWAVVLLLALLGVFPVVSYIYMKKGYDYQVDARAELKPLGSVMALPDTTIFGDTLVGLDMGKQVQLIAYFDPQAAEVQDVSAKYFSEIHEQFNDAEWFRMDLLVPTSSQNALSDYKSEKDMDDPRQVFFYATNAPITSVNKSLFIDTQNASQLNCVALADTTGTILRSYNLNDGKQFVRLIEHIAILRPAEKKEKALFRREREL